MQNRLVLTGIPPAVPRLSKASDSLETLIEENACWVDRFAFISSTTSNAAKNSSETGVRCVAVGVELHIENVRDKAIKSLNGRVVWMDQEGIVLDEDSFVSYENNGMKTTRKSDNRGDEKYISFQLCAHPANKTQSAELIQKCPLQTDDVVGEKRMEKQTLNLPLHLMNRNSVELTVRKSKEHGGTGTYPWRGGLILSRQICHWAAPDQASCSSSGGSIDGSERKANGRVHFKALFCGKKVLELGAGAAGLPSMTIGKIGNSIGCEIDLVSSDGIDEIVTSLQVNVRENGLGGCIKVQRLDWNEYTTIDEKESLASSDAKVDTIIFADCIYNEECAVALSKTISHLLKPGGNVIGVLPDFRVGLGLFETQMKANNFVTTDIPIVATEEHGGFACSGGSGKDYRLVLWRHRLMVEPVAA